MKVVKIDEPLKTVDMDAIEVELTNLIDFYVVWFVFVLCIFVDCMLLFTSFSRYNLNLLIYYKMVLWLGNVFCFTV